MKLPKALSALRHRDFRVYWSGQAISLSGTWMQVMAQGLVVTALSPDALKLGLLNAAGSLPILLLSLKGGEIADRIEKRRILIVTQLVMMALAFVFAALAYTAHLSLEAIFALAVLLGITTAFDLPAAQAMPPELVEPAEIPKAVALMQAIFHGARLIGPAIAGLLIAHLGTGSAFLANGVSFLAVIFTLTVITPRPAKPRRTQPGGRGTSMIGEGFAYVRAEPAVRALLSLTALITALVFPFLAVLMIYYIRYTLGTDDARIMGFMMSASGLGSLIGAAAILSGSPESRRSWLVLGILGVVSAIVGLSFARRLPIVLPLAGILAFSVSSLMGRSSQMVQERVPGELRGRVMGIYSMSFTGIMPFAAMLWSWLIDRLGRGEGYPQAMRISAGLFLVSALGVVWQAWDDLVSKRPPPSPGEPT